MHDGTPEHCTVAAGNDGVRGAGGLAGGNRGREVGCDSLEGDGALGEGAGQLSTA